MRATYSSTQEGQVAAMFALVFALVLVGLVALVGDLLQVYATGGRLDNGALVGAQAGASQVDVERLRAGDVVLDASRASSTCVTAAAGTANVAPADVSCEVDAEQKSVTATVRETIPLVMSTFGPTFTVSRSHTGTVGVGQSQAGQD